MSWNSSMDVHNQYNSMPYNSIGSFVDFFGGLTYDHLNYIFEDASYIQENAYNTYSATDTSLYKFAVSEPGSLYYDYGRGYVTSSHIPLPDDYSGNLETPLGTDDRATASHVHTEGNSSSSSRSRPVECPRNHQDAHRSEVVWQDNIDLDSMTYEAGVLAPCHSFLTLLKNLFHRKELLELGEAVGTQSRGLSQDQIALIPTSKLKWSLFSRKKFRGERCVICQMEYRRGARQMTLPCKHAYHTDCGSRWLSINKACPICYKEVIVNVPKH